MSARRLFQQVAISWSSLIFKPGLVRRLIHTKRLLKGVDPLIQKTQEDMLKGDASADLNLFKDAFGRQPYCIEHDRRNQILSCKVAIFNLEGKIKHLEKFKSHDTLDYIWTEEEVEKVQEKS